MFTQGSLAFTVAINYIYLIYVNTWLLSTLCSEEDPAVQLKPLERSLIDRQREPEPVQ